MNDDDDRDILRDPREFYTNCKNSRASTKITVQIETNSGSIPSVPGHGKPRCAATLQKSLKLGSLIAEKEKKHILLSKLKFIEEREAAINSMAENVSLEDECSIKNVPKIDLHEHPDVEYRKAMDALVNVDRLVTFGVLEKHTHASFEVEKIYDLDSVPSLALPSCLNNLFYCKNSAELGKLSVSLLGRRSLYFP